MKKRNTKSLKLRKSSVSKLGNEQIKGGTSTYITIPIATIDLPSSNCTSFIDACPTIWCPTSENPKTCPLW